MKKGDDEEHKAPEAPREEFVVAPPEPPPAEVAEETSLEARVEALEEGQVQPRTVA